MQVPHRPPETSPGAKSLESCLPAHVTKVAKGLSLLCAPRKGSQLSGHSGPAPRGAGVTCGLTHRVLAPPLSLSTQHGLSGGAVTLRRTTPGSRAGEGPSWSQGAAVTRMEEPGAGELPGLTVSEGGAGVLTDLNQCHLPHPTGH